MAEPLKYLHRARRGNVSIFLTCLTSKKKSTSSDILRRCTFGKTLCIQSSNVFGKKKIFDFVINFLVFLYVSYASAKFFTRMSKLYIFPITSYMSKLLKFFVYVRSSIELDEYNTFICATLSILSRHF